MTITGSDVARYQRDGYLLVRTALAGDRLTLVQTAVERRLARWRATGDGYEDVLHQIHHCWRDDPVLADLVTHPGLAADAARRGGMPAVRVFLDQIIDKPSGGAATRTSVSSRSRA